MLLLLLLRLWGSIFVKPCTNFHTPPFYLITGLKHKSRSCLLLHQCDISSLAVFVLLPTQQWADTMGVPSTTDWGGESTTAPSGAAPPTAAAATTTTTTTTTTTFNQDDWMGPAGTTTTKDWGADDGGDWGGAEPQVSGELLSNSIIYW